MSTASQLSGALRGTFEQPARDVVGLVDDLLMICQTQGLQLDWQTDCCRVRSNTGDFEEVIDRPLPKSVFRAVLARLAALCNERNPSSVSPYSGEGLLSVGTNPAALFRISFANTQENQRLVLGPV